MYFESDLRSQLRRLYVVPLSDLMPSAQVIPRDVQKIASELQTQGVLRHPILTIRFENRHLILDGNARFLAATQIGLPDILIQEIPFDVVQDPLHLPALATIGLDPEELIRIVEDSFEADDHTDTHGLRLIIKPDDVRVMPERKDAPFAIWETFRRMVNALTSVSEVVPLYNFKWPSTHKKLNSQVSVILAPPPLPLRLLCALAREGQLLPARMLHTPVPRRILGINLSLKVLSASEPPEEKTSFVRELIRLRISEQRIQYYDAPVYIVES